MVEQMDDGRHGIDGKIDHKELLRLRFGSKIQFRIVFEVLELLMFASIEDVAVRRIEILIAKLVELRELDHIAKCINQLEPFESVDRALI